MVYFDTDTRYRAKVQDIAVVDNHDGVGNLDNRCAAKPNRPIDSDTVYEHAV